MSKSSTRVLQTLEHVGGFASAQEVHQLIARQGDRIGLTTIYRALQSLQKDKLVDVLRRDDGEAIYRFCGEAHHHHLVCKNVAGQWRLKEVLLKNGPSQLLTNIGSAMSAIVQRYLAPAHSAN